MLAARLLELFFLTFIFSKCAQGQLCCRLHILVLSLRFDSSDRSRVPITVAGHILVLEWHTILAKALVQLHEAILPILCDATWLLVATIKSDLVSFLQPCISVSDHYWSSTQL